MIFWLKYGDLGGQNGSPPQAKNFLGYFGGFLGKISIWVDIKFIGANLAGIFLRRHRTQNGIPPPLGLVISCFGGCVHMSCDLKLVTCAQNVTWGDPPPPRRAGSFGWSYLRAPWSDFDNFFLKISKLSNLDSQIFFMGFVTAWSFDPERFRQKRSKKWSKKHFFSTIFCIDVLVGLV